MKIVENLRQESMRGSDERSLTVDRLTQRLLASANSFVEPIDISSGVYIYGAGEFGILAVEYCEACDIPIAGILDQNKTGQITGKTSAYLIRKPDEVRFEDRARIPLAVAIATTSFAPIFETLKSFGWSMVKPFYSLTSERRTGHPLGNGWVVGPVSEQELATVQWICGNWDDQISVAHYEAFLAWHIDNTELPLTDCPIDPNQRYVIAQLLNAFSRRSRQMVDVGSHKGESIKRLLEAGVEFSEYVLIEPDPGSLNHLEKAVRNCFANGKKIELLDAVLGVHNTVKPFKDGLGYCSQLWYGSTTARPVVTLDSLGCEPDFLKIHTEGSELEVLLGANYTIQKHKPILAFSVYHSRYGLCRIIAEAMQRFYSYTWYFRLHSYQGTGAFVYGVPK
jgi:FkbM family methyltransferase